MSDVVQDFSVHTVGYLMDKQFVEHASKTGTVTMSRKDSHDEYGEQSSDTLFDSSQYVSPEKKTKWEKKQSKGLRKGRGVRVTEDMKEKVEELLQNRPTPHEEYKIYKTFEESPDSYKFLLELLSTHLCMKVRHLHTLLKMVEYMFIGNYGDLTTKERKAFEKFKFMYFSQ